MAKKNLMKNIETTADVLLVVGGLNWGTVQWFELNMVTSWLGWIPMVEPIVYSLVGASALYKVIPLVLKPLGIKLW